MAKQKTTKTILKTVAAGFACAMCTAFFPANAIANAIDYSSADDILENVNTISVDTGAVANKQQSLVVKKGEIVKIPDASFSYKPVAGGDGIFEITNGAKEEAESLSATIAVVEKNTGNKVEVSGENTFRATTVGTYVVTYTVKHGENEFAYDMEIVSQATEASFDFAANVEDVIPNIYDTTVANGRDIIIPLPTVKSKDGTVLVENNIANFVTDTSSADTYVKVTLLNAEADLQITPDVVGGRNVYIIDGEKLSDDKYDGKELKVVYSFYQKVDGVAVYVASTSTSFTVKKNHYFADSTLKEAGFTLDATFASTFPDSAKVGEAVTLPGAVGTTSSKNSPANEGVGTYYSIQVLKMDENGKYTEDVTSDVITEGNKFTAIEEGSYKFVYTVKDFYGHTADSDKVTRIIANVKDTKSPDVYMYDAIGGYNATDKEYTSASSIMKSKGLNRNIIMYAIAGKDNMPSNIVTLTREIRGYLGRTEYKITEEAYNEYNLVFAPTLTTELAPDASAEEKENALYKQIADENFALLSQMKLADDVDINSGAAIKEFMKDGYLLVTKEFNKDIFGNTIDDTITGEDDETAIAKMMAKGYAYVAPAEGKSGEFTTQTYTFHYSANDGINQDSQIDEEYEVKDAFGDEAAPNLTFTSDLQASYLANDKFTFKVASATDPEQDGRLKVVTAYRFINENKQGIASDVTTTEIKYLANRVSESVASSSKWYNQTGLVNAGRWYVNEKEDEYTVDLSKKPEGTAYVEIFAYAIDDYGNVGFFNKLVAVNDATDTDMPVLQSVENAPASGDTFKAPSDIALPTLTFSDAKASFITAKVLVTKIKDSKGNVVNTVIPSKNMSTDSASYSNEYVVNGGYFRASEGGTYQVAITVVDAGNHSVTSYFTYEIDDKVVTSLTPTIDNISAREENIKPGKQVYLTPPSISIDKDEDYGYIGLGEDDDTNTSTWYSVKAVSATSNDYKILNNLYFTAGSEGVYKLKYTAYILKYKADALVQTATDSGDLHMNDEGQLFYFDGSESHLISIDKNNNVSVKGLSVIPDEVEANVEAIVIPCESVITVNVSSASLTINESEMNLHYKDQTEFRLNEKIEIIKPIVTAEGTTSIEAKNTTVTISRNSSTLGTIKLSDWAQTSGINQKDYFEVNEENGTISLIFKKDGKYTISYSVDATVGASDTYSVSLNAGDVTAPELTIGNKLVKENYNVGDTLDIQFSHVVDKDGNVVEDLDDSLLKVSDKVTEKVADLLKDIVVKVRYENESYQTLENTLDGDKGYFAYSHELKEKGTYTLSITITDEAGNTVTKTQEFEVGADDSSAINATEVMGGVLIGLSVALLAGVVIYFVVSKKKLDKKEKSFKAKAGRK